LNHTPRILAIGAHPDDADIKAGGSAAKWRAAGFAVKLVSLCDGGKGHHQVWGPELVERRRAEARVAGAVIGAEYVVLDEPDGELQPTLRAREKVIRLIRSFRPDLVITHRTTDYHPDHCYTGLLVQEAAYLLTVPGICPDVPHLPAMPVIAYFSDAFRHPCPFEPHVVIDIGDVLDSVVAMLDCHVSQFYEWLPYNAGFANSLPQDSAGRRAWLGEMMRQRIGPLANRHRELIMQTYGPQRGQAVELIEAFQISEFGAPLTPEALSHLFPFLPEGAKSSAFARKQWVDIPEE
jgi:LmbE family N-acetylglucosaminyl deacetylase